jgi:hypothetical protein
MGGTLLSGGSGYVFGTLFGVLAIVLIQTLIQFQGTLSSWWIRIVIGALTLVFIGVQSQLAARRARPPGAEGGAPASSWQAFLRRRWRWFAAAGGAILGLVVILAVVRGLQGPAGGGAAPVDLGCQDTPFRQEEAALRVQEPGAVPAYERNGGPNCIDELFVIYSDGRIVGDNGSTQLEKQITPEEVEILLAGINDLGWFTDEMYDTWHDRCGQCYGYYITVAYNGRTKTVKGVDGGTDAPTRYWDSAALIINIIPRFP